MTKIRILVSENDISTDCLTKRKINAQAYLVYDDSSKNTSSVFYSECLMAAVNIKKHA